jgi:predicted dinucleotide-binding enzyme
VVKAFNHIYAAELTTHGQPAGTPNRRALVIAGDDAEAKKVVTKMLDAFGSNRCPRHKMRRRSHCRKRSNHE